MGDLVRSGQFPQHVIRAVLRDDQPADLRLWERPHGADVSMVRLAGPPERGRE